MSISKDIDVFNGSIEGKILENRYLVKKLLDKGSNGLIYKVSDTHKKSKTRLVVKIQKLTILV